METDPHPVEVAVQNKVPENKVLPDKGMALEPLSKNMGASGAITNSDPEEIGSRAVETLGNSELLTPPTR